MSDTVIDALEFTYVLDPAEQARVMALVERRTSARRLWQWAGVLFGMSFAFALLFRWPPAILWSYFAVLAVAGLLAVLAQPLRRWRAARALAEMPQLREVTYRFQESGIQLSTGITRAEISWPGIEEAVETEDLFLMFFGRQVAYYVPKRVVGARASELRGLLREQLGRRAAGVGAG